MTQPLPRDEIHREFIPRVVEGMMEIVNVLQDILPVNDCEIESLHVDGIVGVMKLFDHLVCASPIFSSVNLLTLDRS